MYYVTLRFVREDAIYILVFSLGKSIIVFNLVKLY